MKKSLQNKLKSYSALAGAVATTGIVNAQIIYTNPADVTISTHLGFVNIDLDNGGIADVTVAEYVGTSGGYAYNDVLSLPNVVTGQESAIAQNGFVYTTMAANAKLNLNDPIDATLTWSSDSTQMVADVWPASSSYDVGNWIGGVTDKYIGVRFKIGANTHYGWARFDVAADGASFTLKDYAYDATPNTGIPAGDMVSGISELLANNTIIYGNGKSIHVKITNNASIDGIITITDILGQEVSKIEVTEELTTISMEDAKPGIYFATLAKPDGRSFTKKLFLK